MDTTNIMFMLEGSKTYVGAVRETFFLNQLQVDHDPAASPVSDFLVDGMTFELGPKSKTGKQVQGVERAYVVKDDIEHGFGNVVPRNHRLCGLVEVLFQACQTLIRDISYCVAVFEA